MPTSRLSLCRRHLLSRRPPSAVVPLDKVFLLAQQPGERPRGDARAGDDVLSLLRAVRPQVGFQLLQSLRTGNPAVRFGGRPDRMRDAVPQTPENPPAAGRIWLANEDIFTVVNSAGDGPA